MKNNSAEKVQMLSVNELLGLSAAPDSMGGTEESVMGGRLLKLPLRVFHTFHSHPHGHPFRVLEDARMAETVESVKENGLLQPVIARPDKDYPGEYEILAGHRRHRAAELAGLIEIPAMVQNYSDQEAVIIMTDSNLQRNDILPSELAWAYRMKYDALKELGAEAGVRNDAALAKEIGISRATIQRYIRLTYLCPQLLGLVDAGKIARNPAAELSFLREAEQMELLQIILEERIFPDGEQAEKLHQLSKEAPLSGSVMRLVLEKQENTSKVSLSSRQLRSYFPESYTVEQIQSIIYNLLEEWHTREMNKV